MRTLPITLSILLCVLQLIAQPKETTIAFGSCNNEDKSQEMWKEVITKKPMVWMWGGDNVYADTQDMMVLKAKYDKQKSNKDYQTLMRISTITGTWDDHDYGVGDGGKFYSKKDESKKYLLNFLGIEPTNPVWKHEGVYNSLVIGEKKQKIKIINLDTRTFRDTIFRETYIDSISNKKKLRYQHNLTGDILGEAQWQWLADELKSADAKLFIINSSIQVIAAEHDFEKWANFPLARKRLLDLIVASKKKVIILSGDRHISEFSKMNLPSMKYPLIDFTSSGITHTWDLSAIEINKYRVDDLIIQKSFGLLKINWASKEPKVTMQICGLANTTYTEYVLDFNLYR